MVWLIILGVIVFIVLSIIGYVNSGLSNYKTDRKNYIPLRWFL